MSIQQLNRPHFIGCFLLFLGALGGWNTSDLQAQNLTFDWAMVAEGANDSEFGKKVIVDDDGYVYVSGRLRATVDFTPNVSGGTLTSAGSSDVFIKKIDPQGQLMWVKRIGGTDIENTFDMVVSDSGYIYLTGHYRGSTDFDPDPSSTFIESSSRAGIYILKLTNDGNFIWLKSHKNTIDNAISLSVRVDQRGHVFTTGYFGGTMDFDPGPGVFNRPDLGSRDAYISELDASGNFVWATSFGTSGFRDMGRSLALDAADNLYVTGYYDLKGRLFVRKYDATRTLVWEKILNSSVEIEPNNILIDPTGALYIAGEFEGTVDFDPSPTNTVSINSTQGGGTPTIESFVLKLNNNGDFVWARTFGNPTQDDALDEMAFDAQYRLYLSGVFFNVADFDPSGDVFQLTTLNQETNGYFSVLDTAGNFIYAAYLPGDSTANGTTDVNKVTVGNDGSVYLTGSYERTLDFDIFSPNRTAFTSAGGSDIFTVKYRFCLPTSSTITPSACDSYTAPSGAVYSATGTYTDTIPNAGGCDSIITINLTVVVPDTAVRSTATGFEAIANGVTYQWLQCDSLGGYSPVAGATNKVFDPTSNGSYAVAITDGTCTDTSNCRSFMGVNVRLLPDASAWKVYPNPTNKRVFVQLQQAYTNIQVVVRNLNGQIVHTQTIGQADHFQVPLETVVPGVYFLQVQVDKFHEPVYFKLVKQ